MNAALSEHPNDIAARTAADFLMRIDSDGWHSVVAIVPDGPTEGRTFAPGDRAGIEAFVRRWNGSRNLYFAANEPRPNAPDKSLGDDDIGAIRMVFVDLDVPAGEDLDAGTSRAVATLESFDPTPSFVTETGGGAQAGWLLTKKIAASERQRFDELESGIIDAFGGDTGARSLKNLLRLPGCANLPTRSKLQRHPSRKVREARLYLATGELHDVDALAVSFPTAEVISPRTSNSPQAPWPIVESALHAIPNGENTSWQEWFNVVVATRRAAGAEHEEEAHAAIHDWAARNEAKYRFEDTDEKWAYAARDYRGERTLGAGSLFRLAAQHGWQRPRPTAVDDARDVSALLDDQTPPAEVQKPEPPAAEKKRRNPFLNYDQMEQMPEPEWLIEGLLQKKTAALLFGKSNTFKSFLALDMALHVSVGRNWHGHAVQPGRAAYVATEGAIGVARQRIPGWFSHYEIPREERGNIFLHPIAVSLDVGAAVDQLMRDIREIGPIELLGIDIFGGAMDGTETEDTTARAWTNNVQKIIRETGAAVLAVAHTGWADQTRARMHTHFWGSFDTRLKVEADKDKLTAELTVERHKDADSTGKWTFRMEPTGSTLVPKIDNTVAVAPRMKWTPAGRIAFNALADAIMAKGVQKTGDGWPACRVASIDDWTEQCVLAKVTNSTEPSSIEARMRKIRSALRDAGVVEEREGFAWQTDHETGDSA